MSIWWLNTIILCSWFFTLWGGIGMHALEHFSGRSLEAYCRLKRNHKRFGEILDWQQRGIAAANYLLLIALVVGSIAAGVRFCGLGSIRFSGASISSEVHLWTIIGWITSWLVLAVLAGFWLPRIIVRYGSAVFVYHSWPAWKFITIITRPISGFGEAFTWLGQRLSDQPDDDAFDEEMLEDEIRTRVTAGQREGVFAQGVSEMISGVMKLDEGEVAEIMTPRSRVDAIDVAKPWDEVLKLVAGFGRTRIPVYRDTLDNVVGILYVKDLLEVLAGGIESNSPTLEVIMRKPWMVPGTKPVDELLRDFLHNRNHMAIVIDDFQQLIGVVTIEDALEEIVGEIADELDEDEDSDLKYDEASHTVEAEGKAPVDRIVKLIGWELPESDDYDTIGGLVIHRLGAIPAIGTTIDIGSVRLTVLKATRRKIQQVRLQPVDSVARTSNSN